MNNEQNDPDLKEFLTLLAKDIEEHPERLMPYTQERREHIKALVGDIKVDIEAPLEGEDDDL